MKRFLLFSGEDYYPFGGWHDFKGAYASVATARRAFSRLHGDDWAQIIDTEAAPAKKLMLVWDKYVDLWGTPEEVQAASDAKLAERRRLGQGPFVPSVASVSSLHFMATATSAELLDL